MFHLSCFTAELDEFNDSLLMHIIIIIIIIIILLKFKFNKFLKLTQPAYSIANRGGLCNLQ